MNEDNIYALMEKNLGRNFNREEFDKLMYDYFCHEKITEKIDATICAVDKMSGDIDINVVELAEALSIQYLELEERIDALKKERMIPYWALPLNDKVDFRKTLKRMLKKVTLDSDIKSFDMFLETNINEPFCQGWYSLKPELDISVKEDRAMILLVSGLLEMGLSPINTDAVADGYRIPLNSLVKKELAIMATKESNVFDSSESERLVMLSPRVCGILFRGDPEICSSVSMGHLGSYINNANIKEKKLYFSPSIDEQLSVVKRTFQVESFIAIAERLKKRNRPAGITCLFHGEPGTGKTELAMQIARETGRSIISIDTARITGCYMGESEKAVRQVFLYYRYLLELENVPPILLMNECDGIIGKRTETSRNAAERSDNIATEADGHALCAVHGTIAPCRRQHIARPKGSQTAA